MKINCLLCRIIAPYNGLDFFLLYIYVIFFLYILFSMLIMSVPVVCILDAYSISLSLPGDSSINKDLTYLLIVMLFYVYYLNKYS